MKLKSFEEVDALRDKIGRHGAHELRRHLRRGDEVLVFFDTQELDNAVLTEAERALVAEKLQHYPWTWVHRASMAAAA